MAGGKGASSQLSRYGAIAKMLPFTPGKIFFVLNNANSWFGNFQFEFPVDQDGLVRVYSDLASAYAATTSGQNDVIVLDAGTSNKVTSMLTVANDKVHFIGLDYLLGDKRVNNSRSLISNTGAGASTDVSMVKVTGTGCSFKGIKFSNNWTVAQNLSAMLDYGNNTYFENCTFHNLGSAHLTNANAAPLILAGSDCIYRECELGDDTLQSTAASGQVLLIAQGTSAQPATRVIFDHCVFNTWTSQTTHAFVRVTADGQISRYVMFNECKFLNYYTSSNGALMAVAIASSNSLVSGLMLFEFPIVVGATHFATNAVGNGQVYRIGQTSTAGNAEGIAVVATA